MKQELLSVGIDIGTTTTHLIISRLLIEKKTYAATLPEFKIVRKEIVHQSEIYLTPFSGSNQIDGPALQELIRDEYQKSGFRTADIATGAVIITGETARKENADFVLRHLAEFAGDFVVGAAGPELEAVLAGWGAGVVSRPDNGKLINFDIGGGTTNAAIFEHQDAVAAFALDIGGRLVKFDTRGNITYLSERLASLIQRLDLDLTLGRPVELATLRKLAARLAEMFLELLAVKPLTRETRDLFIGPSRPVSPVTTVSFSGGVAEFIYGSAKIERLQDLKYNDIGPLLGQCLRELMVAHQVPLIEPTQKIRATVVGAGNHTVNLSGSTITAAAEILPLKNVPILKIFSDREPENFDLLYEKIAARIGYYADQPVAVALRGNRNPGYAEIQKIAAQLTAVFSGRAGPVIVVTEHDFAKALGQTIINSLPRPRPVVCLDRIRVKGGDYIDIGVPVLGAAPLGGVVPVVVKTLIFNT